MGPKVLTISPECHPFHGRASLICRMIDIFPFDLKKFGCIFFEICHDYRIKNAPTIYYTTYYTIYYTMGASNYSCG